MNSKKCTKPNCSERFFYIESLHFQCMSLRTRLTLFAFIFMMLSSLTPMPHPFLQSVRTKTIGQRRAGAIVHPMNKV